jgi:hypothetical protein
MKQGRANPDGAGGQKREPIAHKVNVTAVADIGVVRVSGSTSVPVYAGRGLEAPMQGATTHPCGSQGKHK